MELNRLLYATDLEEPGSNLLESLATISKVGLREAVFLHAKGKDAAERYYRDWQGRFWDRGIRVWARREEGDLVGSILKAASTDTFSLVVAEFKAGHAGVISRSALRRLINGLAIPLLIVKQMPEPVQQSQQGLFDSVVFATDWSPPSERAASFLLGFNGLIKEMDIINVIREKLTVGEMRELKGKLQETRRKFSSQGVDAEFHIYAGSTAEEIMLAARDYHSTLIAMGSDRKPLMRNIFSGSSSYKVAEKTVVPALFIP